MDKLDPELKTYYLQVKDDVKKEHVAYISKHPEIRQLLNDFTSTLLLEKPEDVYTYCQDYFSFFNTDKEPIKNKPLVISGPEGVGKSSLADLLVKHFPNAFVRSIRRTTRKPNPGEKSGEKYVFLTPEEFTSEVTKHSFIEHSEKNGIKSGTDKGFVKKVTEESKVCVIEVDIKGAENIRKSGTDSNYIWIDPPTLGALKERIQAKTKESEEVINEKAKQAEVEMKLAKRSDLYEKFILNSELEDTFKRLIVTLNDLYPELALKL